MWLVLTGNRGEKALSLFFLSRIVMVDRAEAEGGAPPEHVLLFDVRRITLLYMNCGVEATDYELRSGGDRLPI